MTDKNPPALVITSAEVAAAKAPFVVAYGGTTYKLRNLQGFSLDELMEMEKISEDNIRDGLIKAAEDDKAREWLNTLPWKFVQRVFEAWQATVEVPEGESDGSETSSEPKSDD